MSTLHASVDARQFHEALSRAHRIAAKRSSIPILGEALVSFDGIHCTITCTNLDQWCLATLSAEGDSFSFAFTKTKSILNACRYYSGNLEFSYTPDPDKALYEKTGTLVISDGARNLQCRVEGGSCFPEFPETDYQDRYPINAEKLLERFNRVKYAVYSDSSRPVLCCIEFLDSRIVAVDGHRLALSSDSELTVKTPFFIPHEAMAELQMFKRQPCTLCVGKKYAAFENESLLLLTRIPESEHWDVDEMIPKAFDTEYPVSVEKFWGEVKYLNEVAIKKERQPIRFDGPTMELETSDGVYSVKMGLPPVPERGFNPKYLLEGLGQFKAKKADTVTMKVSHPLSPVVFTDGEDDLAMVLPVRLKAA